MSAQQRLQTLPRDFESQANSNQHLQAKSASLSRGDPQRPLTSPQPLRVNQQQPAPVAKRDNVSFENSAHNDYNNYSANKLPRQTPDPYHDEYNKQPPPHHHQSLQQIAQPPRGGASSQYEPQPQQQQQQQHGAAAGGSRRQSPAPHHQSLQQINPSRQPSNVPPFQHQHPPTSSAPSSSSHYQKQSSTSSLSQQQQQPSSAYRSTSELDRQPTPNGYPGAIRGALPPSHRPPQQQQRGPAPYQSDVYANTQQQLPLPSALRQSKPMAPTTQPNNAYRPLNHRANEQTYANSGYTPKLPVCVRCLRYLVHSVKFLHSY